MGICHSENRIIKGGKGLGAIWLSETKNIYQNIDSQEWSDVAFQPMCLPVQQTYNR